MIFRQGFDYLISKADYVWSMHELKIRRTAFATSLHTWQEI